MDDVHHLINELKVRDMKLVMDLVVNHTSNQVREFYNFGRLI
jgi:oligo-1,6-glucosidase